MQVPSASTLFNILFILFMNNKKEKHYDRNIFDTWYIGVIKEKEGKIMQSSAELKRQAKRV